MTCVVYIIMRADDIRPYGICIVFAVNNIQVESGKLKMESLPISTLNSQLCKLYLARCSKIGKIHRSFRHFRCNGFLLKKAVDTIAFHAYNADNQSKKEKAHREEAQRSYDDAYVHAPHVHASLYSFDRYAFINPKRIKGCDHREAYRQASRFFAL